MKTLIQKAFLGRRLLWLNVLYWALTLFIADGFNRGNSLLYHYPIRASPVYWPVFLGMGAVQALILYSLTGALLGRLWETGRKWRCLVGMVALWGLAASLGVLIMKLAQPQLEVKYFTHPGFIRAFYDPEWSWAAWQKDLGAYLIGYFIWMIIYALAWFTRKFFSQRRLLRELRLKQSEAELQFLKQQLNPHFLFNTLNNLYGLALQQNPQMPQLLLRLSHLLRYMLYESSAAQAPFEKEKEALLAYIDLERLRLPPETSIDCHVSADRETDIPPLLWLPVTENVFKHGCFGGGQHATVTFRIFEGNLEIAASNSCRQPKEKEGGSGIGLKNLESRLQLLFPERHQLIYNRQAHTFEVKIRIRLPI